MIDFRIKNPKILSFVLANAIMLSQTGCVNTYSKGAITDETAIQIERNIDDEDIEKTRVVENKSIANLKECNNDVYSKKKLTIRTESSKKSDTIRKVGKYQKLKEIGKTANGWSLVKYKSKKGYVRSKNLSNLGDTYIEVDISQQKLRYYKDGKKVLSTDVVTGKDSTPTVTGLFKIYSKNMNYTMRGIDYVSHSDYVLKFYNAYYIHDASWRNSFGGNIYKTNGSHGCINTPYQKVKKLFNNTKLNTKVLIHK